MNPVYDVDGIQIWHADCAEVLPSVDSDSVDLLLTDPPYGINLDTDYAGRGMGPRAGAKTWPAIPNDASPFDPTALLRYGRCILFGANHYADKLPTSAGWIVWDKDLGMNTNDLSDAELAWTNITGGVRVFRHLWKGILQDSEGTAKRVHPTQKPVALMTWILEKWSEPSDLILDPYMGSGPIARACADLGRRYIGIEIIEKYVDAAIGRLGQLALSLEQDNDE